MREAGLITADDEAEAGAFARLARSEAAAKAGEELVHAVNSSPLLKVAPDLRLRLHLSRAVLAFFSGIIEHTRGDADRSETAFRAGADELGAVIEIGVVADVRRPARMLPLLGFFIEKLAIPELSRVLRIGLAARQLTAALPSLTIQGGKASAQSGSLLGDDAQPRTMRVGAWDAQTMSDSDEEKPRDTTLLKEAEKAPNDEDRKIVFSSALYMFGLAGLFAIFKDFLAFSVSDAVESKLANPFQLNAALFPFWLALQQLSCIISTIILDNTVICQNISDLKNVLSTNNLLRVYFSIGLAAALGGAVYVSYICDRFVDLIRRIYEGWQKSDVIRVREEVIDVSLEAEYMRLTKPKDGFFSLFRYIPIYFFLTATWMPFCFIFILIYAIEIGIMWSLIVFFIFAFYKLPLSLCLIASLIVGIAAYRTGISLKRPDINIRYNYVNGKFSDKIGPEDGMNSSTGFFYCAKKILFIFGPAAFLGFCIFFFYQQLIIGLVVFLLTMGIGLFRPGEPIIRGYQFVGRLFNRTMFLPDHRGRARELLGVVMALAMLILPLLSVPLLATLNPRTNDVTAANIGKDDIGMENDYTGAIQPYFSPVACRDGFREVGTAQRLFLRLGGGAPIDAAPRLSEPDRMLVAGAGDRPLVASAENSGDWGLAKRGSIVPIKPVDVVDGLPVTARNNANVSAGPSQSLADAPGNNGLVLEPASIAVRLCAPVGMELAPELAALEGAGE